MTKREYLSLLMLLSALESWAMSQKSPIPDYLIESIEASTEALRREILGSDT